MTMILGTAASMIATGFFLGIGFWASKLVTSKVDNLQTKKKLPNLILSEQQKRICEMIDKL